MGYNWSKLGYPSPSSPSISLGGFWRMRLKEAMEKYKDYLQFEVKENTSERAMSDLRQMCLFLRNREIDELRPDDIIRIFKLMKELGWKQNSIRKKSTSYRPFFKFLNNRGYKTLDYQTIPIPPKEWNRPRVATEIEYKKLLKAIPKKGLPHVRNAAYIRMLWDTGARSGELASLDMKDLEKFKAVVNTEKSRGLKPFRQIFWTEETEIYIQKWLRCRAEYNKKHEFIDPNAVFISRPTVGRWGKRVTSHTVSILMRAYSKKAKIPTLNAHSVRHHKAHEIVKKGGKQADVMNILGHSKLESSNVYVQLDDQELEEVAKKYLD